MVDGEEQKKGKGRLTVLLAAGFPLPAAHVRHRQPSLDAISLCYHLEKRGGLPICRCNKYIACAVTGAGFRTDHRPMQTQHFNTP